MSSESSKPSDKPAEKSSKATPPAGVPPVEPLVDEKRAGLEKALGGPLVAAPAAPPRMTPVGPPSSVKPAGPPAPTPPRKPAVDRQADPLFDGPDADRYAEAREHLARLRGALRDVVVAVDAARIHFEAGGPVLGRAAQLLEAEGFDLVRAGDFVQQATAVVDSFKPRA